jgi:hypothetical protein
MKKAYWTIFIPAVLLGLLFICKLAAQSAPAEPQQSPITKPAEPEPETTTQKPASAQENTQDPNQPAESLQEENQLDINICDQVVSHELKNLLTTYVDKNGMVNYHKLRRRRRELKPIESQLNSVHPAEHMSWSKNERIAFWINSYNIFTLKLVTDNYPIEPVIRWPIYPKNSIMQLRSPWTKHYFKVMGLEYTLREIERGMLVEKFGDPRIGFALSFANIAGPPLLNEPYTPQKLDEQLDYQVKKYLSSPRGLKIDHSTKTIHLSVIFKWYEKYFIEKYGAIKKFRDKKPNIRAFLNFIVSYIDSDDAKRIQDGDYKVKFIRYNWTLNEQPEQTEK